MRTARNSVLRIYPDALVLKDTHNYGNLPGGQLPYLLVHKFLPELAPHSEINRAEKRVSLDIQKDQALYKLVPLSIWCSTEEECWEKAWTRILEKMERKLSQ